MLPVVIVVHSQQQPQVTPRGSASLKKGSLSYSLHHKLFASESLVNIQVAVKKISQTKQTERQNFKKYI